MPTVVDRIAPLVRVQPRPYMCGPAALRHALLAIGIRASVWRLAKLAKTTKTSTTEQGLETASNKYGYRLPWLRFDTDGLAKAALRNYLNESVPVLMCVDRDEGRWWAHWIVAVHADRRGVWICDSLPSPNMRGRRRNEDVLRRMTWREFLARLVVWYPGQTLFDMYPLLPRY